MKRVFEQHVSVIVAILVIVLSSVPQETRAESALNLADAIVEALEKNPEIQALAQRVQSAAARVKQAPYLEDPEISLQTWAVPLNNPTNLNRADSNMVGIRQKVPFFGKLGLKEKIALAETRMVEQELHAKKREVIARVKMAYADLFMAQKSMEIYREQLEIMRGIIRATEARYQVGKVMQQDVFRALLEQSEIMNRLIVAEEESKSNQVKLNALLNRSPQTPIQLPSDLAVPGLTQRLADLAEAALTHRAELKGVEQEIERAQKSYELADRNRKYPDFMLGWDYAWMPTDMTKNRYQAMINITIPFSPWTVGKRNYEVEEALAEIRIAKANRENMRIIVQREIGESFAKAEAFKRSVELYKEGLLSQAELSFRTALAAYQTGRAEFVSLLEARRALREAQMGYYRSLVGLLQNLADLERAVGRELQ
jgi:outer membrane protein, heavy metal efflux system